MFLEAIDKPNFEVERLEDGDYYRVCVRTEFVTPTTVIAGVVKGVTFNFEIPGNLGKEETRALVAQVIKGVEENVFLGPGAGPGVDSVGAGPRASRG